MKYDDGVGGGFNLKKTQKNPTLLDGILFWVLGYELDQQRIPVSWVDNTNIRAQMNLLISLVYPLYLVRAPFF